MSLFGKSNMVYNDYSWTAYGDDNPKITGSPDNILFNRHEGYEVLYLINEFMKFHQLTSKEDGQKIEKMIHDKLPSDTRARADVIEWIERNWHNY